MRRLRKIEIVWQRQATAKEIKADAKRPVDQRHLTGYHKGAVKLVSYRDMFDVDIPVGPGYESGEAVRRTVARMLASSLEPHYETYYVVAMLTREDGTELYRTIIPRTEISRELREAHERS